MSAANRQEAGRERPLSLLPNLSRRTVLSSFPPEQAMYCVPTAEYFGSAVQAFLGWGLGRRCEFESFDRLTGDLSDEVEIFVQMQHRQPPAISMSTVRGPHSYQKR